MFGNVIYKEIVNNIFYINHSNNNDKKYNNHITNIKLDYFTEETSSLSPISPLPLLSMFDKFCFRRKISK